MKCFMNNVRVPCLDLQKCHNLNEIMMEKYNCYLVFYLFDGSIYLRTSTQIYNELEDYEFGAKKFL